MGNFGKVLRLALRYRWTLAASVVCALSVALLWGGNIGAVFPVVKVAIQGQSLQEWVAGEIVAARQSGDELAAQIEPLRRRLAQCEATERNALQAQIQTLQTRLEAEQKAVERYELLQPYVDRYLPNDPFQTLAWIIVALLVGTVVKDVLLIANNILISRLAQLATFDLRKLFYRRTLQMDVSSFGDAGTADLMSRFTHDTESVAGGLDALFGRLVREPLKMAACLIGAAWICWRLLLVSLLIAPVAALLIRWLAKSLKRANRRAMEEMAQIYSTLEETFRGIKIVKAFTNEPQERCRFHNNSKRFYQRAMRIVAYDSLSHPITEVMGIVAISLALLGGAWLVLKGETHLLGIRMCPRPPDVASLLVFYGLLAGAADPMRKLSEVFSRLQRAVAAADRIYARLERRPEVCDPQHPVPIRRHHRELVFEGVEFAYQPGKPVLQDIDLRIGFGETIAVVGPNGCGKSTLAHLILRFADPTAGTIRLDGAALTDVRIRELRSQIGLVAQETLLFDDTVYNNIRYGSPQATHQQVIEAAQRAHAHRFIEHDLPDGYETKVGTWGGRLSGGQRQRIALARAILRNPAIIILDEATSQIDLESEQAIQQALETFIRDRTAVIVTHRLAVLRLADRIVVMQAGRILDVGTHEELLARCAFYRRLHQIQFEDAGEGPEPLAA